MPALRGLALWYFEQQFRINYWEWVRVQELMQHSSSDPRSGFGISQNSANFDLTSQNNATSNSVYYRQNIEAVLAAATTLLVVFTLGLRLELSIDFWWAAQRKQDILVHAGRSIQNFV